MANEVKLTLAGDSKQLERAFDRAIQSADEAGQEMQKTAKRFDDLAERFDTAETRAQGFRDGLTGVQDAVGALGQAASGNLYEGLLLAGSGLADLYSTGANFVVPMTAKLIQQFGLARVALMGLAGAAGVAALAFMVMSGNTERIEADLTHAEEDMKRFMETGRRTVFIRQVFGENARSTEEWARTIELASKNWLGWIAEMNTTWDEWQNAIDVMRAIDEATAGYIDTTGDAEGALRFLRQELGDTLFEEAVRLGLLEKTQGAVERATEREWDHSKSVKATAAAYREAAKELTTFTDLILAQTNPIFGLVNAQNRLKDARVREIEAIQQYGEKSAQAEQAAWDRRAAELALVDAIAKTASVNKEELIPTLQRLADEGLISADTVRAIADAAGIAEDKLRELDGARITINIDYAQRILKPVGQLIAGFRAGGPAGLIRSLMSFHDGGVVPGPAGQEVAAILQAGERVVPLGGDTGQQVTLVLQSGGSELDDLLVRLVARSVRAAGGNVQTVLGW